MLNLTHSPEYLFSLIPPERQISYGLRHPHVYSQSKARTNRFSNSYFQNTIHEWNKLPPEIQASKSLAEFKQKLILLSRPTKNPTYGVFDLKGIKDITKLRVHFSNLNAHKYQHNFDALVLCVTVVWLMRTMSTVFYTALALINRRGVSSTRLQKF